MASPLRQRHKKAREMGRYWRFDQNPFWHLE
jgi:hypothetical protein